MVTTQHMCVCMNMCMSLYPIFTFNFALCTKAAYIQHIAMRISLTVDISTAWC